MTALALLLAFLAASANAAGDLFQRASARRETSDPRQSLALLGRLVRQPRWLAGVVVSQLGLLVHVGALSVGELAVVQPVLVAELPIAVIGASYLFGRGPQARDLLAVGMLAVGLALFVSFLAPDGGRPLAVGGGTWLLGVAVVVAVMAGLTATGWRAERDVRAGLLATAAGVGYGLTGVFFSVTGRTLDAEGLGAALATWQTWTGLLSAIVAFYLLQNGLTAGKLVAAGPGLTLMNPLVAVTWGIVVFGEQGRTGFALLGTAAGAVLLVSGVFVLSRSPALDHGSRAPAPTR